MKFQNEDYEIVVIGAGHAGIEASLAAARLGKKTLTLAMDLTSVGDMPCNPNIGGTGKGHIVREIDALGGEMALAIDDTFIQSRMLNTSKGPAVHSLRVQADKRRYHERMKWTLEHTENLALYESEVTDLTRMEDGFELALETGETVKTKAVIIATGTYLQGTILMGEVRFSGGPHRTKAATKLSAALERMGIPLRRFKTGTPARVARASLDFSKMTIQEGDREIEPFSFLNLDKDYADHIQVPCYLTYTNDKTAKIIRDNLHRSPMYSGEAHGIGPRYCPSIEDKVVRFPDKDGHQIFIEPEGMTTDEMYVQGMSSTMPVEVQKEMYRTVAGMEHVAFVRPAYGIEYDSIDPTILTRTLEHKDIPHLFFAGQICGSSGYEEAAGQGIVAGINAALALDGKEPFVLDRTDAYIGVLIDDLVTKGTNEPYRMMTARSEYRLTLRQDNADLRLTARSHDLGLATDARYERTEAKRLAVEKEAARLAGVIATPTEATNAYLVSVDSTPLKTGMSLAELLRRPEMDYAKLAPLDPERPALAREITRQVEIQIRYAGYIEKQNAEIKRVRKMEAVRLDGVDYDKVSGLRIEARQKLTAIRPESLAQATRISGVSPADINVLAIYLEIERRKNAGK